MAGNLQTNFNGSTKAQALATRPTEAEPLTESAVVTMSVASILLLVVGQLLLHAHAMTHSKDGPLLVVAHS